MVYVDAIHKREDDEILVVERVDGKRVYKTIPAQYVLYYPDKKGRFTTIFGNPVSKYVSDSMRQFYGKIKELKNNGMKLFESDLNPVFSVLSSYYKNHETPKLNLGFFDIEVDYDPDRGFAPTTDPFNKITAVSIHLSHLTKTITLALIPPTITMDQANVLVEGISDVFLYSDEAEMLKSFIMLIEDVDVLSGWNSTEYDIPYIVGRLQKIMPQYVNDLCLWDEKPKKRLYKSKFGRMVETYDLVGRLHLDYLELYRKHSGSELHSFALNAVGELEVKETKVPYEGSLDELYKKDFRKFVLYNKQDVDLLVKIDAKKRYIELANQVAHANGVLLKTTMGSVALVEQAIINEAHDLGFVVPDRKAEDISDDDNTDDDDDDEDGGFQGNKPVVGAYVADPKTGLHDFIGCIDINSLYPSTIRALNMGPETLIAQLRPTYTDEFLKDRMERGIKGPDLWEGVFAVLEYDLVMEESDQTVFVDFEDGNTKEMTGKEIYNLIFNPTNYLCISANGTIFRTDKAGIIPGLLARWYSERKEMQAKEKECKKAGDKAGEMFWNQRQQARKILLNSLYGALLNETMRLFDQRIGQSVTLTGRSIARHMGQTVAEQVDGNADLKQPSIIYQDTDSVYFTAAHIMPKDVTKEDVIDLYDVVADNVNDSFPGFMDKAFNTGLDRGAIIKAGRELIASRGLFIKKKRYAVLMFEKEGTRLDVEGKPGKIKAMGLDLKRSDTPKVMQKFLEEILLKVLTGSAVDEVVDMIKEFRQKFRELHGWQKGTPKRANNISEYQKKTALNSSSKVISGLTSKVRIPGHVQASINWNNLMKFNSDHYSLPITDGNKVIVCKLLRNDYNFKSVAYPIDQAFLPDWFKKLPFDSEEMEEAIIDQKIRNLIGILNWDLSAAKDHNNFSDLFA